MCELASQLVYVLGSPSGYGSASSLGYELAYSLANWSGSTLAFA